MNGFGGATFCPVLDGARLTGRLGRVFRRLRTGRWFTLAGLSALCGGSEASVSARIRDLRKSEFGGHTVERRRADGDKGLWEYRLVLGSPT
jgi:hypothetical protein